MKKIAFTLFTLISLLFVSCSDNDDNHLSFTENQLVVFDITVESGDSLKILCESGGIVSVDWGDGNTQQYKTSFAQNDITYTYDKAGAYQVKIGATDYKIRHLYINGSDIKTVPNISFGKQVKVDSLWLASLNGLTSIDFDRLTNIEKVVLSNLPDLKSINNINKSASLSDIIFIDLPELSELNLSQNKDLGMIRLDRVGFKSLVLGDLTKLNALMLSDVGLSSIDISKLSSLDYFSCVDANLSALDVSNNLKLTHLILVGNKLHILDLSKNSNIEYLVCNDNLLENIYLNQPQKLYHLRMDDNNLSAESLNNILDNLPIANSTKKDFKLQFANNPGSETADFSIASAKGWSVYNLK